MPTDAKRQEVNKLADLLRGSSALAVADYRGLTVAEMHTVRRSLRANGVSLKVAKNRLLKIAAAEAGLEELKPMLDGPTAIATTSADEVSMAKALQEAFRPYKLVTLRGGLLAGQPVSASDLQRLASLPGREVLLARLAGGMAAPLTGMAGVLAANLRNLVGVLSAVADKRRETEGGPSMVVEAAAAPVEVPAVPEDAGDAAADAVDADAAETDAPEDAGAPEEADTATAAASNDVQAEASPAETEDSAEANSSAEGPDSTEDSATATD